MRCWLVWLALAELGAIGPEQSVAAFMPAGNERRLQKPKGKAGTKCSDPESPGPPMCCGTGKCRGMKNHANCPEDCTESQGSTCVASEGGGASFGCVRGSGSGSDSGSAKGTKGGKGDAVATAAPAKASVVAAPTPAAESPALLPVGLGAGVLVLLGCCCVAAKCNKKYNLLNKMSLGSYVGNILATREQCRAIGRACREALLAVDTRASTGTAPREFQPPAEMPRAQELKRVLGEPQELLLLGRDTFKTTVSAAIAFIDDYISAAESWWSMEDFQMVAKAAVGTAFVETYGSVHDLIKVKEAAGYAEYGQAISQIMAKVEPFDSKIDQIADRAERITDVYVQAAQVLPHFKRMIERAAEAAGGSAIVAPLKSPLRVVEKMALRPENGVPWDIVRAQISVDSMEKISQAASFISFSDQTSVHLINDRFSSPHDGGWADCSMSITMNVENLELSANTLGKRSRSLPRRSYSYFSNALCPTQPTVQLSDQVSRLSNSRMDEVMCEIQIVHEYLMMVREGMKQHDAYDHGRFAAELLANRNGPVTPPLPWSVREKFQAREANTPDDTSLAGLLECSTLQ